MVVVQRHQFAVAYLGEEVSPLKLFKHRDLVSWPQRHEFRVLYGVHPRDARAQELSSFNLGSSFGVEILNDFYVVAIVKLRMRKHLAGHREQRLPLMRVQGL